MEPEFREIAFTIVSCDNFLQANAPAYYVLFVKHNSAPRRCDANKATFTLGLRYINLSYWYNNYTITNDKNLILHEFVTFS